MSAKYVQYWKQGRHMYTIVSFVVFYSVHVKFKLDCKIDRFYRRRWKDARPVEMHPKLIHVINSRTCRLVMARQQFHHLDLRTTLDRVVDHPANRATDWNSSFLLVPS